MNYFFVLVILFAQTLPPMLCFFAVFKNRIRVSYWRIFFIILFWGIGSTLIALPYLNSNNWPFSMLFKVFILVLISSTLTLLSVRGKIILNFFILFLIVNYNDCMLLLAKTTNAFCLQLLGSTSFSVGLYAFILVTVQILFFPIMYLFIKKVVLPIIDEAVNTLPLYYLWIIPASFYLIFRLILAPVISSSQIVWSTNVLVLPFSWIIGTFLTYYIVMCTLSEVCKNIKLQSRLRIMDLQIDFQKKEFEQLQANIDETRAAKHDLRHHLLALKGYSDQKDAQGLDEYLKHYLSLLEKEDLQPFCRNSSINSIINHYHLLAKKQNIHLCVDLHFPVDHFPEELDLCILIGNLFKITLSANNQADVPSQIYLLGGFSKKYKMTLLMKSNIPTLEENNLTEITTLQNIAKKNNGISRFTHDATSFSALIIFANPENPLPHTFHAHF